MLTLMTVVCIVFKIHFHFQQFGFRFATIVETVIAWRFVSATHSTLYNRPSTIKEETAQAILIYCTYNSVTINFAFNASAVRNSIKSILSQPGLPDQK